MGYSPWGQKELDMTRDTQCLNMSWLGLIYVFRGFVFVEVELVYSALLDHIHIHTHIYCFSGSFPLQVITSF